MTSVEQPNSINEGVISDTMHKIPSNSVNDETCIMLEGTNINDKNHVSIENLLSQNALIDPNKTRMFYFNNFFRFLNSYLILMSRSVF